MSADRLTILTTRGPLATKRITRAADRWQIEPYGNARHFAVRQIEVADVLELWRALDQLQHDGRAFVIRGEPLSGTDLTRCRRLLYPEIDDEGQEHPATFAPAPRRWIALDFDALPTPVWNIAGDPAPIDPVRDWALVVRAAVSTLPPEFDPVSAWWQMTSSAGVKPGVRLRLWYWLDRPVSDAEAKRWLAGAPVDHALYSPVQAHYVARPIFDPPCLDPVPLRSGMWWRHVNAVAVPPLPEPPPRPAHKPVAMAAAGTLASRAERYATACIRNVGAAPPGERHAAMRRAALNLYSMAEHELLDSGAVTAQLAAVGDAMDWPERRFNSLIDWCRAFATAHPSLPEGFQK